MGGRRGSRLCCSIRGEQGIREGILDYDTER
jgi:hypothetical protein